MDSRTASSLLAIENKKKTHTFREMEDYNVDTTCTSS